MAVILSMPMDYNLEAYLCMVMAPAGSCRDAIPVVAVVATLLPTSLSLVVIVLTVKLFPVPAWPRIARLCEFNASSTHNSCGFGAMVDTDSCQTDVYFPVLERMTS